MRHVVAVLAAVFSLAAVASADPIEFSGVTKVDQGKLLRLKVKLAEGEKAVWSVYPQDTADFEANDRGEFWMTGTPGKYTVEVTVAGIKDGKLARFDRLPIGAEITGKQQQKKVIPPDDGKKTTPPGPTPPPAPTPKAVSLFLVVVEDGATRTADAAKVLGDRVFWAGLQQRGHDYRFYKLTSPEAAANGYAKALTDRGIAPPAVIVTQPVPGTDDATLLTVAAVGKTTAEVEALVKKYSTK